MQRTAILVDGAFFLARYRRLVDRIVRVAGDADVVPAAKLARHEGIDFILDPMWQGIAADLH